MTLHNEALVWVAAQTKGIINHKSTHLAMSRYIPYRVQRLEPDIIQNAKKPVPAHQYHEVEAISLETKKIATYKKEKHRKTLWIVIPEGTTQAFDSIRLIEETQDLGLKGFRQLWMKEFERMKLQLPTRYVE